MRKIIFCTVILFIFCCFNIKAQEENIINLNDNSITVRSDELNSYLGQIPSEIKNAKSAGLFCINKALQNIENVHVGDKIALQLFSNKDYLAKIISIKTDVNGTLAIIAKLVDYEMGHAIITTACNGISIVNVSIPELKENYITYANIYSDSSYLLELDTEKPDIFECETSPVPETLEGISADTENSPITTRASSCSPSAGENDFANIDIIMFYTPAAENFGNLFQGGINNLIAQAMAKTDLALLNSEVNATITLAHSELIDYTEAESGKDAGTDLDRFTGMTDGFMDEVHDIRKQKHADIAVLVEYLNGTGGIGWVLNSTNGKAEHAFNVVRVQQIYNHTTVIHEIGHNLGMCHESENNNIKNPLFPYAFGWYWTGNDGEKYGSVMSYIGDEAPYFSNPNTYYQGQPTGVAGVADNAQVFRKTKQQVAFYSEKIDNFPDVPTDITVSNPTDYGATFRWNAVNKAVKYRICSPIGGGSYRYWETPYTVGNVSHNMFSPCNTYEFWIMAINDCGDGVSSRTMTFSTACSTPTPDANENRNITGESGIIIETKGLTLNIKSLLIMKSVKVYAITGQLVRLENVNSTEVSMDKLPEGIYFIRIDLEGDRVEMKKVFMK